MRGAGSTGESRAATATLTLAYAIIALVTRTVVTVERANERAVSLHVVAAVRCSVRCSVRC